MGGCWRSGGEVLEVHDFTAEYARFISLTEEKRGGTSEGVMPCLVYMAVARHVMPLPTSVKLILLA